MPLIKHTAITTVIECLTAIVAVALTVMFAATPVPFIFDAGLLTSWTIAIASSSLIALGFALWLRVKEDPKRAPFRSRHDPIIAGAGLMLAILLYSGGVGFPADGWQGTAEILANYTAVALLLIGLALIGANRLWGTKD